MRSHVFHVLYNDAAAAAAPPQNQKMLKIGAVYVVRSLHTNFEPNRTILTMFCSQPAKSPHLSTPPLHFFGYLAHIIVSKAFPELRKLLTDEYMVSKVKNAKPSIAGVAIFPSENVDTSYHTKFHHLQFYQYTYLLT